MIAQDKGPYLPENFAALEPFAAWAVATQAGRLQRRLESDPDDRTAFYDAMLPLSTKVITYLNSYPLDPAAIPNDALCLTRMLLMFAEIALSEEIQGQTSEVFHAKNNRSLRYCDQLDAL